MLLLGIIGAYIETLFHEVKMRPLYLVADTVNMPEYLPRRVSTNLRGATTPLDQAKLDTLRSDSTQALVCQMRGNDQG